MIHATAQDLDIEDQSPAEDQTHDAGRDASAARALPPVPVVAVPAENHRSALPPALVQARAFSLHYGPKVGVADIDLDIYAGSVTAIMMTT